MEKLYLAVTPDKYELPICVESDYHVLAEKYNMTPNCLLSTISHGSEGRYKGVKFIRVIIDETEEEKPFIPKIKKVIKPVKVIEELIPKKFPKNMIFSDMEL